MPSNRGNSSHAALASAMAACTSTAGQSRSAPSSPTVESGQQVTNRSQPLEDGQSGPAIPIQRAKSLHILPGTEHVLGIPFKDVRQYYSFGQQLGEGTSGVVRSCVDRRSGKSFACKTILKSTLPASFNAIGLRTEVKAMLMVGGHPAVVNLREVFEDSEEVHLIMDLCEGGDLFERIKEVKQYSEKEAARVCRILISVLQYCNAKGIMHRDFKPENILLVSQNSNTALKVADFGQATLYEPGRRLMHAMGTGFYAAPEVLKRTYGPEADIWSIGVILYILLSGKPPFWAPDMEGVFARITGGLFDLENGPWQRISDGAKDLVRRMMCVDPADRITARQIKNHPWILEHSRLEVPPHVHSTTPPTTPRSTAGRLPRLQIEALSVQAPSQSRETLPPAPPLRNIQRSPTGPGESMASPKEKST